MRQNDESFSKASLEQIVDSDSDLRFGALRSGDFQKEGASVSWRIATVAGVGLILLFAGARLTGLKGMEGSLPRGWAGVSRKEDAPGSAKAEAPARKIQERAPQVSAPEPVTYRRMLENLTVPVIEFEDTSLEEALDFLRLRMREMDPPVPQSGGFVVKLPADSTPPHMTLSMRGATSAEVLEKIAEMTGTKVWITDDFVILTMPGVPEPVLGRMAKSATWDRAAAQRIPVVAYDGEVSLREAVADLNERQPDGPRVAIDAGVDESSKIGGMFLRNVRLADVVQLLVVGTGNQVKVEGSELRIVAGEEGKRGR